MLGFLFFFIFTTGFICRNSYIPEDIAITIFQHAPDYTSDDGKMYYLKRTSIKEHFMFCTAFLGWIFFIVFSGIGFVSLPWDLILDYTYRPKPIDEGNFEEHKALLLAYSLKLRDDGK